jgi:hypothetical protein
MPGASRRGWSFDETCDGEIEMKLRSLDRKTQRACLGAITVIVLGILLVCTGHAEAGGWVGGLGAAFAAGVLQGSGYFAGAHQNKE